MRRKWLSGLLCLLLLLGTVTAALAAGGADDPILSVSWLYHHLAGELEAYFISETEKTLGEAVSECFERLDAVSFGGGEYQYAPSNVLLHLPDGERVTLDAYASFAPTSGYFRLESCEGEIVDTAEGKPVPAGSWLRANRRYFLAEGSGAVLRAYQASEGFSDGYYRQESAEDARPEIRFADIDSHWAKEQISFLASLRVVNGTAAETFSPDTQVTRAMFVTVLGRLFALETSGGTTAFTDVAETDWFAPYVRWAAENGIVNGYEDGRFAPDTPISREQMAAILIRFCNAFGYALPEVNEPMTFADADAISAWAADSVSLAQRTGLVNGRDGGVFDPVGTATRAEMCAVISRLFEKLI